MKRTFTIAGALAGAFVASTAMAEQLVTDDQGRSELIYDVGRLHVAPGAQITFDYCTACHSEMIIAQQGQDRDGWDEILVWMAEDMGMAELPGQERNQILDYLADHYGEDRPNNVLSQ